MGNRLDTALNVIIASAAGVVAITVVSRAVQNRAMNAAPPLPPEPVYVQNWDSIQSDGMLLGPQNALVRIIEFSDLECPFCAQWHLDNYSDIREGYRGKVSFTIMHSPIRSHRFAIQAAGAAECAYAQGRLEEFLHAVYGKQDSIGLKPWSGFAHEALVADSSGFDRCMAGPPSPRIAAGQAWVRKLDIHSTPTFVVNGWRLSRPPDREEVARIIRAIESGKAPF
jgi:protein-disulfide isomerase